MTPRDGSPRIMQPFAIVFYEKLMPGVIAELKGNAATAHIPVIAFAEEKEPAKLAAAQTAGAALAVSDTALTSYLPQLLNQALHIE